MTLNFQHAILLGIASSTIHWLLARSEIARPLWSRASGRLDKLLRCPACSGFWLGLLLGAIGLEPISSFGRAGGVVAAAVLSMWLTPVFETILLWGLSRSAVVDEDEVVDHAVAEADKAAADMLRALAEKLGHGAPPAADPEN